MPWGINKAHSTIPATRSRGSQAVLYVRNVRKPGIHCSIREDREGVSLPGLASSMFIEIFLFDILQALLAWNYYGGLHFSLALAAAAAHEELDHLIDKQQHDGKGNADKP